jgi:hypothetical protein
MAGVPRRRARLALAAALGLLLAGIPGLGLWRSAVARADVLNAAVSPLPSGQAMPAGFVGVSFEYRAMHLYTGRDPDAIDPVLVALLGGLAPGESPVIRIGGDSTDGSWWPIRGMIPQGGIYYPITDGWLRTTQALAADLNAKLILGINLAAGRPAIAAAEGRALIAGIGSKYIDALEIGNEPDLYSSLAWYRDRRGHVYKSRAAGYDLGAYTRQFTQWAAALPSVPLAGPATSGPAWMGGLGTFISAEPRLGLITYHRYPLEACVTDPTSPAYPTIPNLLADGSSIGLASGLAPYVAVAHQHDLPFRVAEMNSASCQGAAGVSDTFASALWALNTLFSFAAVGVDGVNFHMLPGSHYELFTTSQLPGGAWQAFVHPEYYGLLMFTQAFPPGAHLLPVIAPSGPVKVWATQGSDGTMRVVVINQDPISDHTVDLQVPGSPLTGTVETLQAPALTSTSGVTLGGQTFGALTSTGTLPAPPATTPVTPTSGSFSLDVAPGSAELLTVG